MSETKANVNDGCACCQCFCGHLFQSPVCDAIVPRRLPGVRFLNELLCLSGAGRSYYVIFLTP